MPWIYWIYEYWFRSFPLEKGLSVLGQSIGINNVLDALNVVVSTIEHSNVTGDVGGFTVKATCKTTASDASANPTFLGVPRFCRKNFRWTYSGL